MRNTKKGRASGIPEARPFRLLRGSNKLLLDSNWPVLHRPPTLQVVDQFQAGL